MFIHVIEIELLSEEIRGKKVFIPRITLTLAETQVPLQIGKKTVPT